MKHTQLLLIVTSWPLWTTVNTMKWIGHLQVMQRDLCLQQRIWWGLPEIYNLGKSGCRYSLEVERVLCMHRVLGLIPGNSLKMSRKWGSHSLLIPMRADVIVWVVKSLVFLRSSVWSRNDVSKWQILTAETIWTLLLAVNFKNKTKSHLVGKWICL